MASSGELPKRKFIERLRSRSQRYGGEFNERRLDEWIKQGLAIQEDRRENRALRPSYRYGYRQYRRALQLIRLHAANVRDSDAVLIQLFIRGYGVKPHEVRESLWKEFCKAREKLNSPIRSIYADRNGAIPLGRVKQLSGQFGAPDLRLMKAEIVPPPELLIRMVRAARDPDQSTTSIILDRLDAENFSLGEALYAIAAPLISGILSVDEEYKSEAERLILRAAADKYEQARLHVVALRELFASLSKNSQGDLAPAFAAICMSLNCREFAAHMLVMALKVVAGDSSDKKIPLQKINRV